MKRIKGIRGGHLPRDLRGRESGHGMNVEHCRGLVKLKQSNELMKKKGE